MSNFHVEIAVNGFILRCYDKGNFEEIVEVFTDFDLMMYYIKECLDI